MNEGKRYGKTSTKQEPNHVPRAMYHGFGFYSKYNGKAFEALEQ